MAGRGVLAYGLALVLVAPARAQETRFAVVDLEPAPGTDKLAAQVEKEVARLRPGTRPVDDPVMHRLLSTGESPTATAIRLHREALAAQAAGDCPAAVEKARQAEPLILNALSLDEERDLLKTLYALLISCEDAQGREAEARAAGVRLRGLVSLPPSDLKPELWEKYAANAADAPATTELQVDSEPPNAQVSINFHGDGVTPRTLKVAPGLVYVELQKDGYKKAFRAVEVKDRPVRTVLRLTERTRDRVEQAETQLRLIRKSDISQRSLTLSRLAQLARVESLVLVRAADGRVKIWFFDAERGGLAGDPIDSAYDAETGRVAALADRATPGGAAKAPELVAGGTKPGEPAAGAPPAGGTPAAATADALPEAKAQQDVSTYRPRRKKSSAPWWSWVVAGAIGAAFFVFVYSDRPESAETIKVRARWVPPPTQ